ncbi:ras guanine nucleotide exchange factor domain-containing protein [Blastocladiella britannica]|nr:ras guanine nucleotide exchange factor domain-containing protein [Blastocladiella britannica]
MSAAVNPPSVMGVMYREHTLYPAHRKLGRSVVLFNRTTGMLAMPDHRGCVKLDPGAEYIPERKDSDRLKRLLDDARKSSNKHSGGGPGAGGSKNWSSRMSGSLTNLTIRSRRSSSRSITRLSSAFNNLPESPTDQQQQQQQPSAPTPSPVTVSQPLITTLLGDPIPPPSTGFFGTIRGRSRRASVEVAGASASATSSHNSLSVPIGASGRPRALSGERLASVSPRHSISSIQELTAPAKAQVSMAPGLRSASASPDRSSGGGRGVSTEINCGSAGNLPRIHSSSSSHADVASLDERTGSGSGNGTGGAKSAEEDEEDDELSFEEFLRRDPVFKSTPNVGPGSSSSHSASDGFQPVGRTMSPVLPISEEGAGESPSSPPPPPVAQEVIDVSLASSVILMVDNRPATVWANLCNGHLHIFRDPQMREVHDSFSMSENCLALPDAKPGGTEKGAFNLIHDDVCLAFVAKSRDDMVYWVSSLNTAALSRLTAGVLATDHTADEPTGDYRREYEELLKSFDLVELSRIKLPSAVAVFETTAAAEVAAASVVTPPVLVASNEDGPIGTRPSRLRILRSENRMSVLRQATHNDLQGVSSSAGGSGSANEQLHPVRASPSGLSLTVPATSSGGSSALPSPMSDSNFDELRARAFSDQPHSEEFEPDQIAGQVAAQDHGTAQISHAIRHLEQLSESPSPSSSSGVHEVPMFGARRASNATETASVMSTETAGSATSSNGPTSPPTGSGSVGGATGVAIVAPDAGAVLLRRTAEGALPAAASHISDASITASTLDKLVERMACELPYDGQFVDTVLIGYRHVADAPTILDKLLGRMHCVAPSGATPEESAFVVTWRPVVRLRVAAVLKMWIERYWVDFELSRDARERLDDVLDAMGHFEPEDDEPAIVATEMRAFLTRLSRLIRKQMVLMESRSTVSTTCFPTSNSAQCNEQSISKPPCDFLDLDPTHVALQLTMLEFARFQAIRPIECVLHLWCDTKDPAVQRELRGITEMVSSFNQVSYWVATEVVTQPEVATRVKVIERMIKVAKVCRRERNYNTLVAIVAGLNNSAVTRLKQTWEGVSDKRRATFMEMEELVAQTHNFKSYRHVLDTMEHEGWRHPFVPFFGLFLKDLLFWNENQKYTDAGLINFDKLRSIARRIQTLRTWQEREYTPTTHTMSSFATPGSSGSSTSAAAAASASLPSPTKSQASSPSASSFGVPDLVERYCKQLRALKEQAIYKYSCLCEKRAGAAGGDSVRLIDKWATQEKEKVTKK